MSAVTTAMSAAPVLRVLAPVPTVLATIQATRPAHRGYGLADVTPRGGCGGRHCGACNPLPGHAPMPPAESDRPRSRVLAPLPRAAAAELLRRKVAAAY